MRKLAAVVGLVILGVAASAGVSSPSPSNTARVGPNALGVTTQFLMQYPSSVRQPQFRAMSDAGVQVARFEANWDALEPSPPTMGVHSYNWSISDSLVLDMAGTNVTWQPLVGYSATWASSQPYLGTQSQFYPPANDTDFAAFAAALAQRYGRTGTFWAAHPEIVAHPVSTYEIWNEENTTGFWNPYPDPVRYASLFATARASILLADPTAKVIVGGLSPARSTDSGGMKDTDFVAAMYAARPDLRALPVDVGYHAYSGQWSGYVGDAESNVVRFRQALNSAPILDSAGRILSTALGWPTGGLYPALMPTLSEAQRQLAVPALADQLIRSDCGVDQVLVHTWLSPGDASFPGFAAGSKEKYFGMANLDGSLMPTARALSDLYLTLEGRGSTSADQSAVPLCGGTPTSTTTSSTSTTSTSTTSTTLAPTTTTLRPTTTTLPTLAPPPPPPPSWWWWWWWFMPWF